MTMAALTQEKDSYLQDFTRFEKSVAANGHSWLRPIRQEAIESFSELGFPTTRDEDWKFTSVAPIADTPFNLAENHQVELAPQELERFKFPGLVCNQVVFVDGRYSPQLSSLLPLADGVKITSLAEALSDDAETLEPYLARYADYKADAFSALNTAFMEDGAFVYIPRGVVLDEPIHLLYISTAADTPIITHPRNLIVAGDQGQATVVEHYVSLGDGVHFSNAITELVVGGNGVLNHYLIEQENVQAFNVSTLRIQQERSSTVASHSVLLGGALVRNNIHPVMSGEGGDCLINGLFMATGHQHMDNYMKVEHASPHCDSRQFYNGILDERSRGVFHGRIIVHKDAQKTDAKQTNRNLLLSGDTQVDTKPQLEIYADDVKCTHGATIGQMDQEALFYLRSRGISEDSAHAMLLFAFAGESLERMKVEPIRKHLETLVTAWIPQGKALKKSR